MYILIMFIFDAQSKSCRRYHRRLGGRGLGRGPLALFVDIWKVKRPCLYINNIKRAPAFFGKDQLLYGRSGLLSLFVFRPGTFVAEFLA